MNITLGYRKSLIQRVLRILDLKLDVRNERLEFERGQASGAVVAPYLRPFCTIE